MFVICVRMAAQASEWRQHLEEFEKKVQAVDVLLTHLFMGPNKSVLYDLYAYLWDMHGVLGICLAYVKWLGEYLALHLHTIN